MKPDDFIKTIYLGDRCLKGIFIFPWENRVEFQINLTSRVRNRTGNWDFYSGADIPDGKLVIGDVQPGTPITASEPRATIERLRGTQAEQ